MHLLQPVDTVSDILDPYRDQDRTPRLGPCWVMANMVAGLDGTTAVGGRVGALSGTTDAELFTRLRALADVVLVGAETVRRERYGPVRLPAELQDARVADGRPPTPPIAVVTGSLELDWTIPLFAAGATGAAARAVVVTSSAAPAARLAAAAEVADVITADGPSTAGRPRVDLGRAVAAFAERGAGVVLCEGGPALLGELVARDLLDELCLTLAPVMGGDPLPIASVPPGHDLRPFRLAGSATDDGALFLRYVRAPS
jgi:riboflavin biosynthesis pyrimidine reductase